MAQCDELISMAIQKDCDNPLIQGYEREGVIINRQDIDFALLQFSATNKNIITSIPLKTGKLGYKVIQVGDTPFADSTSKLAKGKAGGSATHELHIIIPDKGPTISNKIIDPIMNGEFVMILENKDKHLFADANPGDSAFRVFGLHNGLKMTEGTEEPYSDDTMSGTAITLQETNAPQSAVYLYSTSYAATKTLVEALVAAQ